ncbi:hypothetical protein EGW08_004634 [Elysia chlorotica]|uniref:G-protein coupled receptors family 1 profile domain-containing protein n=1 Tax=Elysia chlorotica TaxID=188477 RepID=A0A433U169_ELYCH|nr:hypothetical protein EGW08_004634 [Elysia chlorotica]
MNLSLDLANSIQDAIDTAQQRDLTLVTFLASLSVIGVLVNSVLLDVYLHTRRKVLSTYFITAVVAIDLIISGVVMPLKIVLVVTRVSVELCAICLSLSYGCIGVSIMLFFCITFDRYQCVCLITRPLITTRNLHLVGSWAAFSALYAGLVAPIYLRGEITLLDDASADDNTRNGNGNGSQPLALREVTLLMRPGYPCYTTTLLSHPRRVWDSRYTVQFVFAVCCSSLVLMVLVLYVLMFLRLRQKDQFRLQLITDKRQGFPKELTARPCCDINDLPPLQKLGAVRHDKMSECQSTSDEFHPSSENTANDDVQPTKDITSIEQKHYKHESTEADCLTTKHEDSTLNDGKQSSTYSPTENNSAFTVTNVKTMSVKSSTPVINPSQETHSPANQVQPSNTKSNPKAVSLTKQNPLVDSSDSSQTKQTRYGDTKTKTHRDSGQSRRSGCCVQPQISLSTRVTARVGLLTLAYCLWWTPFYLSELGLVHYSALMPDIFFMANVMNPLLHLMTSQLFRHQVKARLKVYSARLTARCYPQSSKA